MDHRDKTEVPDPLAVEDLIGYKLNNRRKYARLFTRYKWWNRELTLKCKLKCYVKPMIDLLGVSPSKGNQGATRGGEKILLISAGIEPMPC